MAENLSDKIKTYLEAKPVSDLRVAAITKPDGTVVNYESLNSLQKAMQLAKQDEATSAGDYGCIKVAGDM